MTRGACFVNNPLIPAKAGTQIVEHSVCLMHHRRRYDRLAEEPYDLGLGIRRDERKPRSRAS